MNVNKIIAALWNLLKELERKINLFLDYFLGQEHSLETVEGLVSAPWYFYNPPKGGSDAYREARKREEQYLEYIKPDQENCYGILLNEVDRDFIKWIEYQISRHYWHICYIPEKDYYSSLGKLNDGEWKNKNLQSFRKDQVKIIGARSALIITLNHYTKEWLLVHVKKQSSGGNKSKLIVTVCERETKEEGPSIRRISKADKSGYKLEVKNWRTVKTLEVKKKLP